MGKWDNKTLVRGIKEGDYYAFEALFMQYYGRFVSFADSLLHDIEAAKDLVQEQFMKIWVTRDRLDENKSIRNYLYVFTKRAILNYLRDLKQTEQLESYKEAQTGIHIDSEVEAREILKNMYTKINSLPEQQKKVILLSRKEGLSNKEIAERLGLSVRTVERHISLALAKIRNIVS